MDEYQSRADLLRQDLIEPWKLAGRLANYRDVVTAWSERAEAGAGVRQAAAEAVGAVLKRDAPEAALQDRTLSDLVRLENALNELLPVLRTRIRRAKDAGAEQAALDVPLVGPAARCSEAVVYNVEAFRRGADRGLSLDWSVSSCPLHAGAYRARNRHGAGQGSDVGVVILPLSVVREDACGDITDFRRRLNDQS